MSRRIAASIPAVLMPVRHGTLDDFGVRDYVEDALSLEAAGDAAGYIRLRCASVQTERHR